MNNNYLPPHLKDIAIDVKTSKHTTTFKLKCPCGNEQFSILGAGISSQQRTFWPILSSNFYEDDTGKKYYIEKTFFGIPVRKTVIYERELVKAKCPCCEHEFVLFDSSKHGYNAICDQLEGRNTPSIEDVFTLRYSECEVSVSVQNDLSYDEFEDSFDNEVTPEQYANAFSSIAIYSLKGKKKKNLYDFETA